jgi:hypothetical protein
MGMLEADGLSSLEEQVKILTVFTDLISGIRTVEDVEAWLLRYFYDVGEDPPENKDNPEVLAGTSLYQLNARKPILLTCHSVRFWTVFGPVCSTGYGRGLGMAVYKRRNP